MTTIDTTVSEDTIVFLRERTQHYGSRGQAWVASSYTIECRDPDCVDREGVPRIVDASAGYNGACLLWARHAVRHGQDVTDTSAPTLWLWG